MAGVKSREEILASRWLRPFAHLFAHPALWSLSRRSVPRALAVGLFAAFIIPVGQFLLASLLAVSIRGNVPLAAAATLVTNPFTFAPIYIGAYQVGTRVLPGGGTGDAAEFASSLGQQVMHASGPTAVGLVIFAVAGAALGYAIGTLWWRSRLVRLWNRKRQPD